MKNMLIMLSCVIITILFSFFFRSHEINASSFITNTTLQQENLSEVFKPLFDIQLDETADYKFPSRSSAQSNNLFKPWDKPKLVVIDPGHGGDDPGANVRDLKEKDISLDVALKVEAILKSQNIPTYITRTNDSFVSLYKRIQTANEMDAALFVSIHCNWFEDPALNGSTTLYFPSDKLSSGYLVEKDYARLMQSELVKALGTKDIGIEDRPELAVLRHAQMPSSLVELGFLSNAKEAQLLASDRFRQKAAEGISEGIRKSLIRMSVKMPK